MSRPQPRRLPPRFPLRYNKVHQLSKLPVGQYQFGVLCGTSHRVDTEHAPIACAEAPYQIAYLAQMIYIPLVRTRYHIPCQVFLPCCQTYRPARSVESQRVLPKPYMVFF